MNNIHALIIVLALTSLIAGCASTRHAERETLLSQEIDCARAQEDIARLEAALPTRGERARSAVQSVTPVGVVTGTASGNYKDRLDVFTGSASAELQARIDDIKEICGVRSDESE